MASKTEVITNFSKQTGKCQNGSIGRDGGYNLYYEENLLFSYGHHFPLAIRHNDTGDDSKTGFGCEIKYIINGDKYSVSTNSHQNQCIRTLNPNVQIPFSALQEAWNWAQGDEGWFYHEDNPDECLTHEQMKEKFPERSGNYIGIGYYWKFNPDLVRSAYQLAQKIQEHGGTPKFQIVDFRKDEWWYQAIDKDEKPITEWLCENGPEWASHNYENNCECAKHRSRHKLGAVLLKINDKYFLSSFDDRDTGNYFLCHVPGEPGTVDEAYENLKPLEVKEAEARGEVILRQGDWFFIPSEIKDARWLAGTERKWERLGGTSGTHIVHRCRAYASGDPVVSRYIVAGTVKHSPLNGRSPEHKRLKLGDGKSWWIPVKNTSEAGWGAVGNVD